uniref:NADH dehydrogenase subunit 6 n=1 Tax=Heptathela kimurai TaxID=88333 RepID=UPI0031F3A660
MKIIIIISMFLFMMSNHPFSMISLLIIMTLFMAIFIFYSISTSWFSYILLIVMLSGMMIIFMYMATLSPNEFFMTSMMPMMLISPLIMMLEPSYQSSSSPHLWSMKQVASSLFSFTIIMVVFLFMMMVSVVKITFWQYGPMSSIQ